MREATCRYAHLQRQILGCDRPYQRRGPSSNMSTRCGPGTPGHTVYDKVSHHSNLRSRRKPHGHKCLEGVIDVLNFPRAHPHVTRYSCRHLELRATASCFKVVRVPQSLSHYSPSLNGAIVFNIAYPKEANDYHWGPPYRCSSVPLFRQT